MRWRNGCINTESTCFFINLADTLYPLAVGQMSVREKNSNDVIHDETKMLQGAKESYDLS